MRAPWKRNPLANLFHMQAQNREPDVDADLVRLLAQNPEPLVAGVDRAANTDMTSVQVLRCMESAQQAARQLHVTIRGLSNTADATARIFRQLQEVAASARLDNLRVPLSGRLYPDSPPRMPDLRLHDSIFNADYSRIEQRVVVLDSLSTIRMSPPPRLTRRQSGVEDPEFDAPPPWRVVPVKLEPHKDAGKVLRRPLRTVGGIKVEDYIQEDGSVARRMVKDDTK